MNSPRDKELLELMNILEEDSSLSWTERLQKVIDFKKAKRGLTGFHCSTYPSDPSKTPSNDEIAHDLFMMEKACTEGHFKDVTNMEL